MLSMGLSLTMKALAGTYALSLKTPKTTYSASQSSLTLKPFTQFTKMGTSLITWVDSQGHPEYWHFTF